MRDLRLIGVHEDGQHLLLSDSDGERYRVELDEPLRAAVRRDRPRLGQLQIEIDGGMRPREVQALIRAGLSAEEVADRAAWPVEKVRRYEGPILAEREHVAGLAKGVRLRARSSGPSGAPTLSARVSQRLSGRGVDPAQAEWDSARGEGGEWTVVLTFPAGGRERQARWSFDVRSRTVAAADDEARWLSEEDTPQTDSPLPAPHLVASPVRATTVYDVEAEGGLVGTSRRAPASRPTEEPLDLMMAMRERAAHRGRPRRRKSPATQTPLDDAPREDALPLEDLAYDPESMPPPPAARGTHARDDEVSGPQASGRHVPDDPADRAMQDHPADRAVQDHGRDGSEVGDPGADETGADVLPSAEREAAAPARGSSARTRAAKRSGRPSVPSWDDVMFGARPRD